MKYNRYIPSYEDAILITEKYDNFQFFYKEHMIGGYRVVLFSYCFILVMDDIVKEFPHMKGHELRGLIFVFNEDGSLYKRYLSLDKFYNINQLPHVSYDIIKDYKIKSVVVKEDGSLINFFRLPNGVVLPKTIEGFSNDQTKIVNEIYSTNEKLREFINKILDDNKVALFELVSPKNRIVVEYFVTELVLLKIRDNDTGEYLDINSFGDPGVRISQQLDYKLDDLIELSKTRKDVEGWVVEFENGMMVKIKTEYYFSKHGIYTELVHREDYIVKSIIENTIDDLISRISNYDEILVNIEIIREKINKYTIEKIKDVENLISKYDGNTKEFALLYKKDPNFSFAMNVISYNKVLIDLIKNDDILVKARRLERTREWLNSIVL